MKISFFNGLLRTFGLETAFAFTDLGIGEPGPAGRPAVAAPVPVASAAAAGHAAPAVAGHGADVVLWVVVGGVGVGHPEDLSS